MDAGDSATDRKSDFHLGVFAVWVVVLSVSRLQFLRYSRFFRFLAPAFF